MAKNDYGILVDADSKEVTVVSPVNKDYKPTLDDIIDLGKRAEKLKQYLK